MSRQDLRKLINNVSTLILLLVCLFIISSSHPIGLGAFWGQTPKKSITHSPQRNQPVRVDKIVAAGNLFKFEAGSETTKEFDSGEDWMKDLTVSFENTSNKNIVYAEFLLLFPETEVAGPIMSSPLKFGRYPEKAGIGSFDKLLRPGEKVDIVMTAEEYDSLQSFLKRRSFINVNSLRLVVESVIFDDDTLWSGGVLMKRDPSDPSHWKTIDKQ